MLSRLTTSTELVDVFQSPSEVSDVLSELVTVEVVSLQVSIPFRGFRRAESAFVCSLKDKKVSIPFRGFRRAEIYGFGYGTLFVFQSPSEVSDVLRFQQLWELAGYCFNPLPRFPTC